LRHLRGRFRASGVYSYVVCCKLPVKLSAGLLYNVVQPTYGGRWLLNAHLTLIF
jgi:hypothetical protein